MSTTNFEPVVAALFGSARTGPARQIAPAAAASGSQLLFTVRPPSANPFPLGAGTGGNVCASPANSIQPRCKGRANASRPRVDCRPRGRAKEGRYSEQVGAEVFQAGISHQRHDDGAGICRPGDLES